MPRGGEFPWLARNVAFFFDTETICTPGCNLTDSTQAKEGSQWVKAPGRSQRQAPSLGAPGGVESPEPHFGNRLGPFEVAFAREWVATQRAPQAQNRADRRLTGRPVPALHASAACAPARVRVRQNPGAKCASDLLPPSKRQLVRTSRHHPPRRFDNRDVSVVTSLCLERDSSALPLYNVRDRV